MAHSSFLEKLTGQEYGRLWAWGNKPKQKGEYELASPCNMSDLPQSHLEPILVEEAKKLGAEFRFSTEFVSVTQDESGVSTVLRDRNTEETYTVRSSYLIGGDGARSGVVNALGIPISGRQINTASTCTFRPTSPNTSLNVREVSTGFSIPKRRTGLP